MNETNESERNVSLSPVSDPQYLNRGLQTLKGKFLFPREEEKKLYGS